MPPRGIGDKTLPTLALAAQRAGMPPGEVLLDLGRNADGIPLLGGVQGPRGGAAGGFWRDAGELAEAGRGSAAARAVRPHRRGYRLPGLPEDGSEEGDDRWENVQELRRLAFEFQERGLIPFLENLALVSDQDTVPEQAEAPTLLTLHAAKGLEFHTVFITGLDEGLLPHSRCRDDPEEMAEERRLFYVGLTRAKDRLYLVRAEQRSGYGAPDWSSPSRFLDDIPASLVTRKGISEKERQSRGAGRSISPPGRWRRRAARSR